MNEVNEQPQTEDGMDTEPKAAPTALLCKAMAQAFPKIAGALKEKTNLGFKSKYADLGAVVDAIKPALAAHGLWFSQNTQVNDKGAVVETILWHESGECMSMGVLFMPATKMDAQGFGSALTYCRRYSLMTAFGVPAEDDDGNAAVRPVAAAIATAPLPKVDPARRSELLLAFQSAKTLATLNEIWGGMSSDERKAMLDVKNTAKERLTEFISA